MASKCGLCGAATSIQTCANCGTVWNAKADGCDDFCPKCRHAPAEPKEG